MKEEKCHALSVVVAIWLLHRHNRIDPDQEDIQETINVEVPVIYFLHEAELDVPIIFLFVYILPSTHIILGIYTYIYICLCIS